MGFYVTDQAQDIVKQNVFLNRIPSAAPSVHSDEIRRSVPQPFWSGHDEVLDAYWYSWKTAFANIKQPHTANGFVDSYIDTAFNECIFFWDSAFMTMFGKYASSLFHFENTLNNFYGKQHQDGFICRQIRREDGADAFDKHDPSSTGPNIFAWAEYKNYRYSGNLARLKDVFIPILAYHRWLSKHRTWKDGSYWSNGWACGMDNQPRQKDNRISDSAHFDHGFLSWSEITVQQYLSARTLLKIAKIIGYSGSLQELELESANLSKVILNHMWSQERGFLFDLDRAGNQTPLMSIGAYWLLHTDLLDKFSVQSLVEHLRPGGEFDCKNPIPTLATTHENFADDGNYWCGGVWAPTNYMVFDGLVNCHYQELCADLARRHVNSVVAVYQQTKTVWENYSPTCHAPGNPSKPNFVGWTGLSTITILIEHVLGIRVDNENKKVHWFISLPEEHGIKNLALGDGTFMDLHCKARASKYATPEVTCHSNDTDYELLVSFPGK